MASSLTLYLVRIFAITSSVVSIFETCKGMKQLSNQLKNA